MFNTERLTYEEWISEQEDPQYLAYIITGSNHWKNEFIDKVKDLYGGTYEIINNNLKENIKKLNYRPLRGRKHVMMYESIDKISSEDMLEIVNYLRNPSKYGLFILSINDWSEKRAFNRMFPHIERSKVSKMLDLDFPSREFIHKYIIDSCEQEKVEFEDKDSFDYFVRRVQSQPKDIVDNIQTLGTLDIKIDRDSIKTYTEDYSSYTYDQLYSSLANVNRKTVPYISYNDLIESGRKETTIMINIRRHFHYLYQAKYLKTQGILRNNDMIDSKKHLYERGDVQFSAQNNIFDLPEYRINRYLRDCDEIPLSDIIRVMCIIDKNMPRVHDMLFRKSKGVGKDKNTSNTLNDKIVSRPAVYEMSSDLAPFKTVLELMGRREKIKQVWTGRRK